MAKKPSRRIMESRLLTTGILSRQGSMARTFVDVHLIKNRR